MALQDKKKRERTMAFLSMSTKFFDKKISRANLAIYKNRQIIDRQIDRQIDRYGTVGKKWYQVFYLKTNQTWGLWMAQWVRRPTLSQVMISQLLSSSSTLFYCAESSEPGACFWILCLLPSLPLPCSRSVSLCVSKINIKKNKNMKRSRLFPF